MVIVYWAFINFFNFLPTSPFTCCIGALDVAQAAYSKYLGQIDRLQKRGVRKGNLDSGTFNT